MDPSGGASDGLGVASNTVWAPLNGDWEQGAVSVNTDFALDGDQCVGNPASNMFTTYYKCIKGDNSVTIVKEPSGTMTDPCSFELLVDSSILCAYVQSSSSSTGGHPISSSAASTAGTSTGPDSTGSGGGGQPDSGLTISWAAVIAVISVVAVLSGVVAGVCVALYIIRRYIVAQSSVLVQMNRTNQIDGTTDTYAERLL